MDEERFRVGDTVDGKYVVERVLGEGGMGRVVAARQTELGRRVALKCLLSRHAQNPELVARFLREGRAQSQLQSEHVTKVFDVARTGDGSPYLVMELLDGEDVAARIQHGPLPVADAVDIVLQASEAVAEAHSLGIVHRDLKPANLFLAKRRDGRTVVKVLDFGIAKIGESADASLTKTATAIGSAVYMSPEQLRSARVVDARTDVWALGVILFELLTGELPFEGDDVPTLSVKIVLEEPRTVQSLKPEVPAELADLVARCLRKDPADRMGSVAELATALAPFASERSRGVVATIDALATAREGVSATSTAVSGGGVRATMTTAPTMLGEAATTAPQRAVPGRSRAVLFLVSTILLLGALLLFRRASTPSIASGNAIEPPGIEREESAPPSPSTSPSTSSSSSSTGSPAAALAPSAAPPPSVKGGKASSPRPTPSTAKPSSKPTTGFKPDEY